MYLIVKHSHMTLMLISVIFLIIRVLASTQNAQWLQQKWAKIAPHVIDTFLLVSALVLMVIIAQYPIANHWLSAKVIGLVAYIGFGTLAFKGQKSTVKKLAFLLLALGCIGYMISVAVTKSPMPWSL
ncbi:MAG: SirB2 family protein [Oceanospirillaceae bacterium]|nr:SirB2 family protein [Oceanospirillaceae bacterium]